MWCKKRGTFLKFDFFNRGFMKNLSAPINPTKRVYWSRQVFNRGFMKNLSAPINPFSRVFYSFTNGCRAVLLITWWLVSHFILSRVFGWDFHMIDLSFQKLQLCEYFWFIMLSSSCNTFIKLKILGTIRR